MRAGALGLSLLLKPLDVTVLQTLSADPLPSMRLYHAVGSPPETTLRKHLQRLAKLDVVNRARQAQFPAPVSYELSQSGRELVEVADALARWLAAAPVGPLQIGTHAGKLATKALIDAWSTRMLRALAARPLTLTQLDRLIQGVNYPALERRLGAMKSVTQVTPARRIPGGTPYVVTRWLREAVGPLMAAADWEHRRRPESSEPLGRLEVETAFLLLAPLLELRSGFHGTIRLAMELPGRSGLAGVVVTLAQGKAIACRTDVDAPATSSIVAPADAWLAALGAGEANADRFEGDRDIARAVIGSMRATVARQGNPEPTNRIRGSQ